MSRQIISIMFLLFSQAEGLSCITCSSTSGSCSGSSQSCVSSALDTCSSMTTTISALGTQTEVNTKSCFNSSRCINASLNVGTARVTLSTLCCNTDNCNTQTPPAIGNSGSNGRQCFTCNLFGQLCSSRIDCVGDEDRCISATVTTGGQSIQARGCATSSICTGDLSSELGSVAADVRCCEGNLCNGAWGVGPGPGASVVLLLWPVMSVLLFR
ncbi:urokinase plasminogen activator surface receptor-like [Engraulis encrasicolus]|uniref:urokinase plasminogen activator surface receptor-like n=1 Tax=Engraulis encrasicolus TaxID=184585 RepID=UPI002FD4AE3C